MKKCKVCSKEFTPKYSSVQMVCSTICSINYAKSKRKLDDQNWKKRKKVMKESLMETSDYLILAQKTFNTFIRYRDKNKPCISCGTNYSKLNRINAGHYKNAGYHFNVRFDEENVYGQCVQCNMHLHGNPLEYREALLKLIGEKRLEALEERAKETRKFTKDELIELIDLYREKIKKIKDC